MPLALHMQVFTRFVEVGRVALISYGPDEGKLCTIVNVIDHNRVLVDGPAVATGVHRHAIGIKRLMLTDLTVGCKLNATEKNLKKCWEAEGTLAKWEASSWAKKRKVASARKPYNPNPNPGPSPNPAPNPHPNPNPGPNPNPEPGPDQAHALRSTTTDFDRFRVMVAKKERSKARAAATK